MPDNIARLGANGHPDSNLTPPSQHRVVVNFTIEVLAPGFDKNELDVTVKDGLITVKGNNTSVEEKESKNYLKKGFTKKSFSRTYKLTDKVDLITYKIDAKFENGILFITIEKKKVDEPKPIKIEIK